jgi:uncharacterized protein YvpB
MKKAATYLSLLQWTWRNIRRLWPNPRNHNSKPATRLFIINLILTGLLSSCVSSPAEAHSLSNDGLTSTETRAAPVVLPTIIPTATVEPTQAPTLTPTLTITPSSTPITPSPSPTSLAEEHYILNIRGHRQFFPIGCETSAAVDWAAYHKTTILEYNFQMELPVSDNPDLGFVGDVRGPWGQVPPYAYGVYAGPVAATLQKHGLPAKAVKGASIDDLKAQIDADHPAIVWVIGNVVGGVPAQYTDSKGNTTVVAAYEHVVIVTGYNKDKMRYMNNGKFYDVPTSVFENSWKVLGNMAIVWDDSLLAQLPPTPQPTTNP